VHASVRHRNMRDYHIELRNCATDQTISDVIVTWDETPFTRFIDKTFSRDWLLSPTSIGPSSSASIFLFSLKDDLRIVENKNDVLGRASTFTVRASGKGIDDLTARFRYEPDKVPKLRMLWRWSSSITDIYQRRSARPPGNMLISVPDEPKFCWSRELSLCVRPLGRHMFDDDLLAVVTAATSPVSPRWQ